MNISYYSADSSASSDEYVQTQCKLDILYPKHSVEPFTTIVWFHGGGLEGGQKYFPSALQRLQSFKDGRLAIVAVGYRLAPRAAFPAFIDDAACAVSWVLSHIEEYGGDPQAVFVCGGSAGGYLTAMLGSYSQWLEKFGASRYDLAGYIPVSGQMTTHFLVKRLLNYPGEQYNPVIDENAPLGGISKDFPPFFFVLGDRKIEWKCRVEENELMCASLRALGAPIAEFSENPGFTHGISGMGDDIPQELLDKIDAFMTRAVEYAKTQTVSETK
ncbi:MAG: alpha/beta hydrolase [Planctomycetia bacterium]|nr:alpha/beta hydrolase [Planctomycetia bacterium]